jgi:nitrite reductase (NADH) large subunit
MSLVEPVILHTQLLIVGGGMAAGKLLQHLAEKNYQGIVTVASAETVVGYNRVLLPDFLGDNCSINDLYGQQSNWQSNPNYQVLAGVSVVDLNKEQRVALLSDGRKVRFQLLVIATGGIVPPLNIPGEKLNNVTQLRSIKDAIGLKRNAKVGQHAVVIGGGLLGLEAGRALLDLGMSVRVVHRNSYLLNRQLDEAGAAVLMAHLEEMGFEFSLNRKPSSIWGTHGQVSSIEFDNGELHPADLVIIAAGIQPNVDIATMMAIECDHGICVDNQMQSTIPWIYAIGECASISGRHYSLVDPVFRQAETLAATLCGEAHFFKPPPPATRLKIAGTDVFSAGASSAIITAANDGDIVISDVHQHLYRRLIFSGVTLSAVIMIGDASGTRQIEQHLGKEIVDPLERERLAFGF